jgi:hypothetical protein
VLVSFPFPPFLSLQVIKAVGNFNQRQKTINRSIREVAFLKHLVKEAEVQDWSSYDQLLQEAIKVAGDGMINLGITSDDHRAKAVEEAVGLLPAFREPSGSESSDGSETADEVKPFESLLISLYNKIFCHLRF